MISNYVVAAFLLRSRETQVAANCRLREEIDELKAERDRPARQLQKQQQMIDGLKLRTAELERERDAAKQSVNLPEDPPIATHGYGARMIPLAVNVARSVGWRGAERVLRTVSDWLGVEQATPTRTAIRNWLQRLGLYVIKQGAELQQPLQPHEDLVIMVDHSNQIGTEKVLLALGVNASALPEPGNALTHEDVRVLGVKPGRQWKTENMEQEYEDLADR